MVRHTLKILQQMLQDFQSVPGHFGTLWTKGYTWPKDYKPSQQNSIRSQQHLVFSNKNFNV